jgi:hypothetical protein
MVHTSFFLLLFSSLHVEIRWTNKLFLSRYMKVAIVNTSNEWTFKANKSSLPPTIFISLYTHIHTYIHRIENTETKKKKKEMRSLLMLQIKMYLCMYGYMLRLLSIFNRHAIEQFIYIQKKNQMCYIVKYVSGLTYRRK